MRTDLTIRTHDGIDCDVAVEAPDLTTFASAMAPLIERIPAAQPRWSARERVRPESVVGRGALRCGAVITSELRTDDDSGAPGVRLEIVGGPGAGRGVTLIRRSLTVGRAASCDLVLRDARASRRHAVVTVAGTQTTVRDLGSTHGTRIDNTPVSGEATVPPGSVVVVGDSFLAFTAAPEQVASLREGANATVLVNRPPRVRPRPNDRSIRLPSPPAAQLPGRTQWIAALPPALAGVVLAWLMHSAQFLAFASLTPLALLAGAAGDRLSRRRTRRRALSSHRHAVAIVRAEIASAITAETALRRAIDPDPAALRRIACAPTTRLWERRRTDDDLLRVRIGLGTVPSAIRIDDNEHVDHAAALQAVPGTVDLANGPVGVAAPAPIRDAIARWIVAQLAVLTSPDDVEIALVLSDDTTWRWARWLPHLRGRVATTATEREAVVDDLADLARSRHQRHRRTQVWSGPRVVVVLDRIRLLGTLPRLATVLAEGPPVGLTALCLDDAAYRLPGDCTQVIRTSDDLGNRVLIGAATVVADRVDAEWAEQISRALAPLRDGHADSSSTLPAQCRLADLPGFELGQDLADRTCAEEALARWQLSDGSASTVLGIGPDGPVWVDLDRDGPHLLVVGTTGAGKSELLQTLITGLAVRHPPRELCFLLIDYKGGAAFAECAELPHTVGLVTDLDNHLLGRVLASLDSEVRRREQLLADAGACDLAAYRAGGGVLPRLVLVVDEFATLADELSGVVPGLVGIAQRGRSLGLHLVLATQRPAGVVSPEIRANTALRIALRVTAAAESIEVIDGSQAASIHPRTPGRGYLRAGTTTTAFQTAQVAVSGPNGPRDQVHVTILDNWRRASAANQSTPPETDLRRYVRSLRLAAAGQSPVRRPWLPPLPERIVVSEISTATAASTLIPIGLLDLPMHQSQEPLALDLSVGESVLIVGSPRTGRSTALVALAMSAACRCSPADLHIHAVDGGGSGLSALRSVPHVGTIATLDGGLDVAAALMRRVHGDISRRRDARSHQARLVLLVDGWEQLLAASEEHDGGRTVDRLFAVLRDAPGACASVVITGGRSALAPRLTSQIRTRLLLRLNDPADYALAGIDVRSMPSLSGAGRGVRVDDGAEFQFARFGSTTADQARLVAQCITQWRDTAPSAFRLRPLPARVVVAELPAQPGRFVLGLGGDEATPITLDPQAGAARLLVAGPARSGRSTLLCSMLRQSCQSRDGARLLVAAPARSLLAAAAREVGVPVLGPSDPVPELSLRGLLLVDDADAFTDTDVGDALTDWVRADVTGRSAIVAARNDSSAVAFRGLMFEVRQSQCGVLLQPSPVDGELLGVRLPRTQSRALPGRGVLIPDPAWGLGQSPLPLQVALP